MCNIKLFILVLVKHRLSVKATFSCALMAGFCLPISGRITVYAVCDNDDAQPSGLSSFTRVVR